VIVGRTPSDPVGLPAHLRSRCQEVCILAHVSLDFGRVVLVMSA
jgi:hypothetical protein